MDTRKIFKSPLIRLPLLSKFIKDREIPINLPEYVPFCLLVIGFGLPDLSCALLNLGNGMIATPRLSLPFRFVLLSLWL